MNILLSLDDQLNGMFKYTFDTEISHLRPPDIVMSELVMEIIVELSEEVSIIILYKIKLLN